MKVTKESPNVEFDVIYDNGERKHVTEGVLFEAENNKLRMHVGTNRLEVLFCIIEGMMDMFQEIGLVDALNNYLARRAEVDSDVP